MKIQLLEEPDLPAKPKFKDLYIGDVFRFDGRYYLKVSLDKESLNTISVSSNSLAHFNQFTEVEPKNFILQEVNS